MAEVKHNIHKDHRKRVKERFRSEGLDHFSEIHALELLLFFAIPQGDTNPLAHKLLNQFGSLTQVLDAPVEELEKAMEACTVEVLSDGSAATAAEYTDALMELL